MTEEILIKVELDKPEAEKQVNELSKSITTLTTENKNLLATNKELEKQGKANTKEYLDNTKQIEINKQKINENNSSRKNLIQAIIAEDNSIKGLQIRNRELVQQRNLISTATEEGRAAIQKINAEIDRNNEAIKSNVSNLEKQKINVGNYASALDGVIPGLGGFVSGIQNMTKASLAFIATPIGAIIGAIGLALGALIAYFKGSEEGQTRLNRIMQVGGAIMGKIMDVVRDLGEAIFNAFTNPKEALQSFADLIKNNIQNRIEGLLELFPKLGEAIDLVFRGEFSKAGQVAFDSIAKVTTGIEDATSKVTNLFNEVQKTVNLALTQAEKVARLQELLREKERQYEIDSANTFLRVSELKVKAEQSVGEERRKAVAEAIALEEKLADKTVELAQIRFNLAKQQSDIADNDIEANNALIKAEADLIRAKADRFNKVKELATKLFAVENQLEKERQDRERREEDELIAQLDKEIAQIEEFEGLKNQAFIDAELELKQKLKEIDEKDLQRSTELANKRVAVAKAEQQQKDQLAQQALATAQTVFGKSKTASSLLTIVSTHFSAQKAFESQFLPVPTPSSPVRGAIAAALAIAQGLARVAQINAVPGFARGGVLKPSQGTPIQRSNGDDRLITAKVGETILTREQTARIGTSRLAAAGVPGFITGGRVLDGIVGNETRIAAGQAESQFDINRLAGLINGIQPVLVYQDFEIAQDNILGTRNRAQVI